MATLVQSAPVAEPTFRQHYPRQTSQQQQLSYTAAVPVDQADISTESGSQPTLYKQINIIPGLDADNAVVDTGIKLVRPTGGQVQVSANTTLANEFDGKRMRRSIQRRTVDYNASAIQMIKHRLYKKSLNQKPVIHPDPLYYVDIVQPRTILYNPINSVTTRFVRASTNKIRCPVFTVAWTPEGRRVVTGTSSGEFTLWNGLTFNFETILQAHESAVRAMEWSHNDMWLLSGDHNGVIKYWQSNMNNVKMIQAHTDPIRGVSFCPTDNKFVTCSDDGLLKVWDFYRCQEESILRGHGADVKCCGWHPTKSLIASGSKDSQQPLKLWDPRSGSSLATIHGHKSTVMDLQWNKNGNWILTGSRDRLLKVYDIRVMKDVCTFRGHKKEAASVNWHPLYEKMFASGGSDGSIMFWLMGCEKELGVMDCAHDGMIWDLKWHPLGHILCSGSNDHTTKFWTRNRPADKMRDKYNLNVLPAGFEDDYEYELPDTEQSEGTDDTKGPVAVAVSSDTPVKKKAAISNDKDSLKNELNTPAVKALIEQASLEVSKPDSTDAPAQVYTLSQLRPTAPAFKIDSSKQREAIDEVERLEKRRERLLKKGIDSKGLKRSADSDDDDGCRAPSLLDLDIAPPAFLQEQERQEQNEMAYMNEMNQQQQQSDMSARPSSPRSSLLNAPLENDGRHFDGPGIRPPLFDRPPGPSFDRPPHEGPRHPPHGLAGGPPRFDRPQNDRSLLDAPPDFNRPPQDGRSNFIRPPHFDGPPSSGAPHNFDRSHHGSPPPPGIRFNGPPNDGYMDGPPRPNENFDNRPRPMEEFGERHRPNGEFMNRSRDEEFVGPGRPTRPNDVMHDGAPGPPAPPAPPERMRPNEAMPSRLAGEFDLRPIPSPPERFANRPSDNFPRPDMDGHRFDNDRPMPDRRMEGPLPPRSMEGPHPPHSMDGPRPPHSMDGPLPPRSMEGPLPPRSMEGPLPPRFNNSDPRMRHENPRPQQFNGPRFEGHPMDNRGPPLPHHNAPYEGPPQNGHPRNDERFPPNTPPKRWDGPPEWQDDRMHPNQRPNEMNPNWERMDNRERMR